MEQEKVKDLNVRGTSLPKEIVEFLKTVPSKTEAIIAGLWLYKQQQERLKEKQK